jgi:hypothetical protein
MNANARYTALEILEQAKVENAIEKFGKLRIRIAGIRGIVKPDHVITLQPNTQTIDILVGNDSYTLDIKKSEKTRTVSEGVLNAKVLEGTTNSENYETLQDSKAQLRNTMRNAESELNRKYKDLEPTERQAKVKEELDKIMAEEAPKVYL